MNWIISFRIVEISWLLLFSALLIFIWAIVHYRRTDRRQCPKCWYDLSGTESMRCSECGYEAKHEKKLHRAKYRRHTALDALAVAFFCFIGTRAPNINQHGWVCLVPTTAIILLSPALEDGFDPYLGKELGRRIENKSYWEWQKHLLVKLTMPSEDDFNVRIRTRPVWPEGADVYFELDFDEPENAWLAVSDIWFDAKLTGDENEFIGEGVFRGSVMKGSRMSPMHGVMEGLLPGQHDIEFEVEANHYRFVPKQVISSFDIEQYRETILKTKLFSTTLHAQFQIGGDVKNPPQPIMSTQLDQVVRKSLDVRLAESKANPGLFAELRLDALSTVEKRLLKGLTIAGYIDILHDDDVVYSCRVVFPVNRSLFGEDIILQKSRNEDTSWIQDVFPTSDDPSWRAQFRSNYHAALTDLDAKKFWAGRIDEPIVEPFRFPGTQPKK